jgi:hypothetical protein
MKNINTVGEIHEIDVACLIDSLTANEEQVMNSSFPLTFSEIISECISTKVQILVGTCLLRFV